MDKEDRGQADTPADAEAELQRQPVARFWPAERLAERPAKPRDRDQELLRQARSLEAFFKHALTPLVLLDRQFNYVWANEAYAAAAGRGPGDFHGRNHFEVFQPEARPIFERVVETRAARPALGTPMTFTGQPERGTTYWDWTLEPILGDDGGVRYLVLSLEDVTEVRRLEKEILELDGRQRRRIGQDLHDVLGQGLTGIALMCKSLENKLAAQKAPEAFDAAMMAKLVNQAMVQARALARGLCPVDLKADGLMMALQDLAASAEQLSGLIGRFVCADDVLVEDDVIATQVYLIAQEAYNNAVKHARARQVTMRLAKVEEQIRLTVEDDGVGLPEDLRQAGGASRPPPRGMGLRIMNYRASMINGQCVVRAGEQGGTVVECSFPAPRSGAEANKP